VAVHEPDGTSDATAEGVDESRAMWDAAAGGWERQADRMWAATRAVSEGLVEMAAPRPGETVLELAAGAGDTGLLAAERIAPGGRLIISDRSPQMLDAARRNAERRGTADVEFAVLDAEALALGDASVDVVLCRWAFMLMADPVGALSETRRVLTSGGRAALAVWGPRDANAWNTTIMDPLIERGLAEVAAPGEPGMYRLADGERLDAMLRTAGFSSVELRELPVAWRFAQVEDYWRAMGDISPSLGRALHDLAPADVQALRADVAARASAFRTDDGYELPGVAIGALAR
jgi:ubiquinone/menaquinone biosynthesis C-methylase UbiE